ncbi:MAG: NDP-hexose 2,3-dehydratase family protein, partial [Bacillales bacterium]|nr:NDP-hexose 2,3-dehydratase family protein [Bacillales bacterium]
EGGRFFHEQNRNVIIEFDHAMISSIPEDYMWVDFATLNFLVQNNNCLNIQLRNLLSLLQI